MSNFILPLLTVYSSQHLAVKYTYNFIRATANMHLSVNCRRVATSAVSEDKTPPVLIFSWPRFYHARYAGGGARRVSFAGCLRTLPVQPRKRRSVGETRSGAPGRSRSSVVAPRVLQGFLWTETVLCVAETVGSLCRLITLAELACFCWMATLQWPFRKKLSYVFLMHFLTLKRSRYQSIMTLRDTTYTQLSLKRCH